MEQTYIIQQLCKYTQSWDTAIIAGGRRFTHHDTLDQARSALKDLLAQPEPIYIDGNRARMVIYDEPPFRYEVRDPAHYRIVLHSIEESWQVIDDCGKTATAAEGFAL